jgi:hypothetical protein
VVLDQLGAGLVVAAVLGVGIGAQVVRVGLDDRVGVGLDGGGAAPSGKARKTWRDGS